MKKSWIVDAAIGLVLGLVVIGSYLLGLPLLESLELKSFDMRSKLRQNLDPASEIILISINDASLSQLGRWPWPRSRIAAMLEKLAAAKPKVIGLSILFSEPEQNQGLSELQALEQKYKDLTLAKQVFEKKGVGFAAQLAEAQVRLDSDTKLLAALQQAGNVVLPMYFSQSGILGAKPPDLPPAVAARSLAFKAEGGGSDAMPDGSQATTPLIPFAEVSAGIGHMNLAPDFDGVIRRETPVIRYNEGYYPSFALALVLSYLGLKSSEVPAVPGMGVRVGSLLVPMDEANSTLITFNGPYQTFRYYPFHDVMNDKVAMEVFKDKIVILGATAAGISTLYVTPVAHNLPGIELTANIVENILHKRILARPPWAQRMELGLLALVMLFVMLALPRLKALWGAVSSLLLLTVLMGLGTYFFINGEWIKVTYPGALLAVGYTVIISKRFLVTEKGKELVEASAIETNKMLGLSFQGQGMLDLAFEKFRLCPLDDNMKETLYNLALDFERKRQYAKAVSALGHIAAKDAKFKDISEKMATLKAASDGAVFGGIGGGKKDGTVMIAGGAAKPTLGRYEIEKELGRGAMGIVYLGKDPKINRQVAIKTMVLEEGSDAEATKGIKDRFFREAESAGTLNHPNIVRIFDAGEEQEIAYIAMELLDGHDLTPFTSKSKLLPMEKAMEYVAIVADALAYAHGQGIVHRDIKPANVMLLKDGTIRVADFGIARIAASSKTATGTVMGTPSYMSPEQIAGKKVDGRADIFSLTVALFELLTGEKPFKGGDNIGTLLFQIANDPHPNPAAVNPKIPPQLAAVINKGLAKKPEERFASASELAAALRACIQAMKSAPAPAAKAPAAAPAPRPAAVAPAPVPPAQAAQPAADKTLPVPPRNGNPS